MVSKRSIAILFALLITYYALRTWLICDRCTEPEKIRETRQIDFKVRQIPAGFRDCIAKLEESRRQSRVKFSLVAEFFRLCEVKFGEGIDYFQIFPKKDKTSVIVEQ